MHRFLAEHRLRLFGDGLFADLFGPRGRPSVPGSVIAVVMAVAGVVRAARTASDGGAAALRCALEGRGGPGHRR